MAKKTRKFKRPLSWYIIWIFIGALLIALITGLILSLPVWRLSDVQVEGTKYFPVEKIISVAAIPANENIFQIDTDEIHKKLSAIVQFREVRVNRRLPGTILIRIKERAPFAVVLIDNIPSLIDEDGYILARKSLATSIYSADIEGLPAIRGIKGSMLEKGKRLGETDRAFIKDSLNLLKRFLNTNSIQVEVGDRSDITIYIEDIIKVRIGSAEDIDRKVKVLSVLLDHSKDKLDKLKYIDVRLPDEPVIRFK
jgi:cell division protein FtsQ